MFFDRYRREHDGRVPTHREIAAALGLKSTTAAVYLEPLRKKKLLQRTGPGHRNLRVTRLGQLVLSTVSRSDPPRPAP